MPPPLPRPAALLEAHLGALRSMLLCWYRSRIGRTYARGSRHLLLPAKTRLTATAVSSFAAAAFSPPALGALFCGLALSPRRRAARVVVRRVRLSAAAAPAFVLLVETVGCGVSCRVGFGKLGRVVVVLLGLTRASSCSATLGCRAPLSSSRALRAASSCSATLGRRTPLTSSRAPFAASSCLATLGCHAPLTSSFALCAV